MTTLDMRDTEVAEDAIYFLPIGTVHADPKQPRRHISEQSVEELRTMLSVDGMLMPLLVRPHPEQADEWMVIDGGRRLAAAQGVLADVPCRIRLDLEEPLERLRVQLNANTGVPLSPLDEARAYQAMLDADPRASQATIAKLLGKPRSSIGDRLRLLEIGSWLAWLDEGRITVSHAVLLGKYSGASEAVARATMARLLTIAKNHAVGTEDGRLAHVEGSQFRRLIGMAFQPFVYALDGVTWNIREFPKLDRKAHNNGCDCGAPKIEHADGLNLSGPCCLNPDWWQPARDAASTEEVRKERERQREYEEERRRSQADHGARGAVAQDGAEGEGGDLEAPATDQDLWDEDEQDVEQIAKPTRVHTDTELLDGIERFRVRIRLAWGGSHWVADHDSEDPAAPDGDWLGATARDAIGLALEAFEAFENAKARACKYCTCTESAACELEDGSPCSWHDATVPVCSNPRCVSAYQEDVECASADAEGSDAALEPVEA